MPLVTITSLQQFHELINTNKKVVVDFHATWCGPCKVIAPKYEGFSNKYTDIVFAKVDVDDVPDVASEVGVRAMPTFAYFLDGVKAHEVVGASAGNVEEKLIALSQ
ncbi:thioredoxin [Spinellus fusiger]|nr:thioredoxin [Spinellus fusiger]